MKDVFQSLAHALASKRMSSTALFVAVGIWMLCELANYSFMREYEFPRNPVIVGSTLLYIVAIYSELSRIWRKEYDRKDAIAILVLLLMAGNLGLLGQRIPFTDAIAVFAMRNEKPRRILSFCVAMVSIGTLIIVVSSLVGILENHPWVRGDHLRYALGFSYCLDAPQILFTITCALCWLRDGKITWAEILFLAVLNSGLFLAADGRLSFGLSMLALLIVTLRKAVKREYVWRFIGRMSIWNFFAVAMLSVAVLTVYAVQQAQGAEWLNAINNILGGRIKLAYDGVINLGWQPFGQNVEWHGAGVANYNYVDNLLFHTLIQHGLLYVCWLFCLYTLVAYKGSRNGDAMLPIMLGVLALHFILDDLSLILAFNPLLIIVGSYLVSSDIPYHENKIAHTANLQ